MISTNPFSPEPQYRLRLFVVFVMSMLAGQATFAQVTAPPAQLKLDPFYAKYISANGYPIVSSRKVSDFALKEAAYLVNLMLAKRPDVKAAMINNGSRLIVMAHTEFTSDIPEHAHLKPHDFWDARARGLGGSEDDPVCSCAEENLLCFSGDPYSKENILIHEFAHNIHLVGLAHVDSTFDDRLKQAYELAMDDGLWKTKYASTNHAEYWAEGVQSWFNNNRPPDHDHNHVGHSHGTARLRSATRKTLRRSVRRHRSGLHQASHTTEGSSGGV